MANIKQVITQNNESVLLNFDVISSFINKEDLGLLVDAMNKEVGKRKLAKEEIEQLQALMNVDALEAAKWKKTADVLKYISVFAIAEDNPEVMRKITEVLLGILGLNFPIANTVQGVLAKVPDRLFSALIQIGGLPSPNYLIYRGVNLVATKKIEKAKIQNEYDICTSEARTTLFIVCKNKLLSTEMNKLIESEDDLDDGTIVGTKDGAVHTIIWNESAWEAFHDKLTSEDRVLIIGKIKNTRPLTSEQIRFEKFGVKYGWHNNIATIEADPKALHTENNYREFLSVIDSLQIPEKLKKSVKFKLDWLAVGKLAIFPPLLLGDIFREGTEVKKQQLLFGLYSLYLQDLDVFLDMEYQEESKDMSAQINP